MLPSISRMRCQFLGLCVGAFFFCGTSSAFGHYLWVTLDEKTGEHGITNIYFEHGASPGNGDYLDRFVKNGTSWIRTLDKPEARTLKVHDKSVGKKRWLTAELPADGPRSIDSASKFGVYTYGKTNVLLYYYARYLDLDSRSDLEKLARSKQMKLDIVPRLDGEELELQVFWQGKPAGSVELRIQGPGGLKEVTKTNDKGLLRVKAPAGKYWFRTSIDFQEAGSDDGENYTIIRHHATLQMVLPADK